MFLKWGIKPNLYKEITMDRLSFKDFTSRYGYVVEDFPDYENESISVLKHEAYQMTAMNGDTFGNYAPIDMTECLAYMMYDIQKKMLNVCEIPYSDSANKETLRNNLDETFGKFYDRLAGENGLVVDEQDEQFKGMLSNPDLKEFWDVYKELHSVMQEHPKSMAHRMQFFREGFTNDIKNTKDNTIREGEITMADEQKNDELFEYNEEGFAKALEYLNAQLEYEELQQDAIKFTQEMPAELEKTVDKNLSMLSSETRKLEEEMLLQTATVDSVDKYFDLLQERINENNKSLENKLINNYNDIIDRCEDIQDSFNRSLGDIIKDDVKNGVKTVKESVTNVKNHITEGLSKVGNFIKDGIISIKDHAKDAIQNGAKAIGEAAQKMNGVLASIGNKCKEVVKDVKEKCKPLTDKIKGIATWVRNDYLENQLRSQTNLLNTQKKFADFLNNLEAKRVAKNMAYRERLIARQEKRVEKIKEKLGINDDGSNGDKEKPNTEKDKE